ncbi:MAG: hypothetical protein IKC87_01430 [Clostridia bacterium]|nr:hypothetical protein [Clostridia bacterium]
MRNTRAISLILVLIMLVGSLASCLNTAEATKIRFSTGDYVEISGGEAIKLEVEADGALLSAVEFAASNPVVAITESGLAVGMMNGTVIVTATYKDLVDEMVIKVTGAEVDYVPEGTEDDTDKTPPEDDGTKEPPITDDGNTTPPDKDGDEDNTDTDGDKTDGDKPGGGNTGSGDTVITDKYANMTKAEFYASYKVADSYLDAQYRSKYGFMSGLLTLPDAVPNSADHAPKKDGKYVRNTATYFSDNGNTYTIVDGYGNEVLKIYYGGGYITLEEVAAYVYAFGEVPANYDSNRKNKTVANSPKSEWSEYLRLNDSQFSGDTDRYPDEPALPDISGCGGDLYYNEIDIGTSGYNNGTRITRGACRIVYVKSRLGTPITDPNERYVFYTYNHYSDFQEYLNYYRGWGERFGDDTGGGTPSPYVKTAYSDFSLKVTEIAVVIPYYIIKREENGII